MLKLPRQIDLVRQTKNNNCAAACLSMVSGVSIEEIEKELQEEGFNAPYGANALIRWLTRHDIYAEKVSGCMSFVMMPNSVYIATTSSPTKVSSFHMIVMASFEDSARVLDPSDDLETEQFYDFGYDGNNIPCFEFFHLTDCSL